MLKPHKLYPTQQACCLRPRRNCAVRNTFANWVTPFRASLPSACFEGSLDNATLSRTKLFQTVHFEKINSEVSRRGVCKHHVQIVSANRSRKRHRYRYKRSRRPWSPPHRINPNAFSDQLVAKLGCTENSNPDVMMVKPTEDWV